MYTKKTYAYIAGYLLFVLAIWIAYSFIPHPKTERIPKQPGVIDLSTASFSDTVYQYRDNHWDSYPEQYLLPADIESNSQIEPQTLSPEDYRQIQYVTHQLQIKLPPGKAYALSMQSTDYAMRIFVGGEALEGVGMPGTTRETTVPRVLDKTYFFTPTDAVTTIIVHAANFVHGKSGCQPPDFTIGTAEAVNQYNEREAFIGALVTGGLLAICLYHLALYALNRRRVTTLLFSGCCLVLTLYNKRVTFMHFPDYNWFVGIRFEYFVHFLIFAALVYFVSRLFPGVLHRGVTRAYYLLTLLYTLTLLMDTHVFTGLLAYFEYASIAMIVYVLARMTMALKGGGMKAMLGFLGIVVLGLCGLNDILYYREIPLLGPVGRQLFTTPLGMMFFVFCYGLVLALEYAETERAMVLALESEQRLTADNAALDRLSRMKSDLMATVSHETRTPLAVLSGYAELISMELRQKGMDAQTTRDLDKIAEEIQRIAAIMEEMQSYAKERENAEQKAWISLAEVIEQSARLYAPILTRKNTRLLVELPDELPLVFANAGELTQVLFNLLQNAKNHTENGSVTLRAEAEAGGIAVTVSDTGEGIPPELLPDIFTRGVSSEPGGTGIGLAVCKEIITGHGGSIEVQSKPGEGTVVRFTLPNQKEDSHGHANDGLVG